MFKLEISKISNNLEKRLRDSLPRRVYTLTGRGVMWGLIGAVLIYSLFPLVWMTITSLQPEVHLFTRPPEVVPHKWSLEHYIDLWESNRIFFYYYRNSIIVSVMATVATISLGTLAAYSISRFEYRGKDFLDNSILLVYMFPAIVLVVPLGILMSDYGLTNSWFGLAVVYLTFALPFSIWVLREFFNGIPYSLEEAAIIDGASRMQAFVYIVLPNALPGIIATAIFTWSLAWNDFLYASVIMSQDNMQTLPVGLNQMLSSANPPWGQFMAANTLVTIPVLILYILVQDYLVEGFGAGGVKG
ncbi:MAG: carbohydrate ABC transporter permease [Natronomonas sp.]|nr:carbohydrate ABC transporter permease [Natronomonas sp.]